MSESGSWCLSEDIKLDTNLTISGAETVVELCLCGHELRGTGESAIIFVTDGATLNIMDCYDSESDTDEEYTHSYRYAYLIGSEVVAATATASGGLINGAGARGCIQIQGDAVVNVYGGTIAGGKAQSGGGVSVIYGELNVFDGVIEHNMAIGSGGGIFLQKGSKQAGRANLYGGAVRKNAALATGGGVHVSGKGAVLRMEEAQITGNEQTSPMQSVFYGGGGIYLDLGGTVEITGGEISGNTSAALGGGIFVSYYNRLSKTAIQIQGNVVVADNEANGEDSNVYLYYEGSGGKSITELQISGALTQGAQVGISYGGNSLSGSPRVCVPGDGYTISVSDMRAMFSDDGRRALVLSSGEILVSDGRSHTMCGQVCDHEENHPYVVYTEMDKNFDGGTLSGGDYYLTGDISLANPIVIPAGACVCLCLSGYTITNLDGACFEVEAGATLSIADCAAGRSDITQLRNPATANPVSVQGGVISGNAASIRTASGGIRVNGGRLELYGGTVGCASQTSGVSVTDGGEFYLCGGGIVSCYSQTSGGGIYVDESSKFVFQDGRIENNYTASLGGGVYAESNLQLKGEAEVVNNTAGIKASNIYLPRGVLIEMCGCVVGTVGISMEVNTVFTTGGGAASQEAFQSDEAAGTYVETRNGELCIQSYQIMKQPSSKQPTVVVGGPENVQGYQWYAMQEESAQPVTGELMLSLGEGDGVKIHSSSGMKMLCLEQETEVEIDGEMQCVRETVATCDIDENGEAYIAALTAGTYYLTAGTGETLDGEISLFRKGTACTKQTGATYTGTNGWYACRIEYISSTTVLYSNPFEAIGHRHEQCGSTCAHEIKHTDLMFTPLANNFSGGLIVGEEKINNLTLRNGDYYLASDIDLSGTLRIEGTVTLCLNGNTLHAADHTAIYVAPGADFVLCTCGAQETSCLIGHSDDEGGAVYVEDAGVELYGITVADSSAQQGGGLYLSGGSAKLENCIFKGNSASADGGGIYLSAGNAIVESCVVEQNSAAGNGGGVYLDDAGLTLRGYVSISENAEKNNLYLAKSDALKLEKLDQHSQIGVAAAQYGPFTQEGAEEYLVLFQTDTKGSFISCNEDRLGVTAYAILSQPDAVNRTICVNSEGSALFQWYSTEVQSLEGVENISLAAGQIVRVKPEKSGGESITAILSSEQGVLEAEPDDTGCFMFYIEADGLYSLQLGEIQYTAEVYTLLEPLEGQRSAKLTMNGNGGYICFVYYPDGTELRSELLLVKSKTPVHEKPNKQKDPEKIYHNPFQDVAENDWYYDYVMRAYDAGIMWGTTEGNFSPMGITSRGMFVTMLWRMGGKESGTAVCPFEDVDAQTYYSAAVRWAFENGIVLGIDERHFAPEIEITREQAIVMLYRYARYQSGEIEKIEVDLSRFSDTPSGWAYTAVQWAVANGLIQGYPDSTLGYHKAAIRADMATILVRYLKLEEDKEEL